MPLLQTRLMGSFQQVPEQMHLNKDAQHDYAGAATFSAWPASFKLPYPDMSDPWKVPLPVDVEVAVGNQDGENQFLEAFSPLSITVRELAAFCDGGFVTANVVKPCFAPFGPQHGQMRQFAAQEVPSVAEANVASKSQNLCAEKLLEISSMAQTTSEYLSPENSARDPQPWQQENPAEKNGGLRSRAKKIKVMAPKVAEQQFHKTKRCTFHQKGRCALGMNCAFAHSRSELAEQPDLFKTKFCYNFIRGRCTRNPCNYAHGNGELRSVQGVNTTEVPQYAQSVDDAHEKWPYAHSEMSGYADSAGISTQSGTDEDVYEGLFLPPGLVEFLN
jgi:hypothetical protein